MTYLIAVSWLEKTYLILTKLSLSDVQDLHLPAEDHIILYHIISIEKILEQLKSKTVTCSASLEHPHFIKGQAR